MKTQLAALLALAFGASTALAGMGEGDKPTFDEVDSDGDGRITQQEASGKVKEDFDKLDRDGNGHITATEYDLGPRE
jgi:Ca2+-binding EF-hand superfamily protein